MLPGGDALEEAAASGAPGLGVAPGHAALLLHAPGAVGVLQGDALPARGDLVAAAAVQLDGLDLVVRHHHQLRAVQRAPHAHHVQVLDGDVVWKHLDLLDHHRSHFFARVVRRRVQRLDHLAVVGADEDDVVFLAVRRRHLRVDSDFGEAIPGKLRRINIYLKKKQ